MSHHDTLTLRDALRSIQYDAATLADAQVIALQALNATYPARAALSATQSAQAKQSDAASEVFTALADHCPVDNGWFNGRAAQGAAIDEAISECRSVDMSAAMQSGDRGVSVHELALFAGAGGGAPLRDARG